jgi:hypothetical protein
MKIGGSLINARKQEGKNFNNALSRFLEAFGEKITMIQ